MTRPISTEVSTGITGPLTLPGFLVEIDFPDAIFRASSRSAITWNGNVWVPFGMKVTGLGSDGTNASSSGQIQFDDLDNALGTLILGETVGGANASVWMFYGDGATLGASDPTVIFSGYASDATFDINNGTLTVAFVQANATTMYLPRQYITREAGFNHLPPLGQSIAWGNNVIVLQAE